MDSFGADLLIAPLIRPRWRAPESPRQNAVPVWPDCQWLSVATARRQGEIADRCRRDHDASAIPLSGHHTRRPGEALDQLLPGRDGAMKTLDANALVATVRTRRFTLLGGHSADPIRRDAGIARE